MKNHPSAPFDIASGTRSSDVGSHSEYSCSAIAPPVSPDVRHRIVVSFSLTFCQCKYSSTCVRCSTMLSAGQNVSTGGVEDSVGQPHHVYCYDGLPYDTVLQGSPEDDLQHAFCVRSAIVSMHDILSATSRGSHERNIDVHDHVSHTKSQGLADHGPSRRDDNSPRTNRRHSEHCKNDLLRLIPSSSTPEEVCACCAT